MGGIDIYGAGQRTWAVVSKPWGETSHYDFVVQGGDGPLLRVQVKSAANMWHGGYTVNNKGSQGPYPENAFDFMAVYVIPLNTWFIVPETVVRGKRGVQVQPRSKRSKYAEYKEAWQLLGGREEATESREDAAGPER